jgi:hypothetical protein
VGWEEAGRHTCGEHQSDHAHKRDRIERLLHGRTFTEAEVNGARKFGVVNRTFAKKFLAGDALGQRATLPDPSTFPDPLKDPTFEIIGIVADVKNQALQRPAQPEIWVPYSVMGGAFRGILVRRLDAKRVEITFAAQFNLGAPVLACRLAGNLKLADKAAERRKRRCFRGHRYGSVPCNRGTRVRGSRICRRGRCEWNHEFRW